MEYDSNSSLSGLLNRNADSLQTGANSLPNNPTWVAPTTHIEPESAVFRFSQTLRVCVPAARFRRDSNLGFKNYNKKQVVTPQISANH